MMPQQSEEISATVECIARDALGMADEEVEIFFLRPDRRRNDLLNMESNLNNKERLLGLARLFTLYVVEANGAVRRGKASGLDVAKKKLEWAGQMLELMIETEGYKPVLEALSPWIEARKSVVLGKAV